MIVESLAQLLAPFGLAFGAFYAVLKFFDAIEKGLNKDTIRNFVSSSRQTRFRSGGDQRILLAAQRRAGPD